MNKLAWFFEGGEPDNATPNASDLFKQDDFRTQYELARQQLEKRFGSPCAHEHHKNGRCTQCFRKVVTKRA